MAMYLQTVRLKRLYGLTTTQARLVASLYYGEGAA